MKTTTAAFAAALALLLSPAAHAATVTLSETPCLQPNTQLETFTIETDKLVVKELKSVCGLNVTAASGTPVDGITCRAFKDADGKVPGSAPFSRAQPALIATNPVQEGSIRCDTNGTASSSSAGVTASAASTLLSVVGSSASSGTALPTAGANATVTVPSTPTASGTGSATSAVSTGAAGRVGFGVGAVLLGAVAMVL